MAATPSVKITKTFTYRGAARKWSNRYHFNGGTPANLAAWNALFDAITTAEKAMHKNGVTIVEAVGYAAGSDLPIAAKSYSLVGTAAPGSFVFCPGDCAGVLRWETTARSAKNHPVYLFNYFHNAGYTTAGDPDVLNAGWKSLIEAYATAWISGFSDGTNTYVRAGPNGATAVSRTVLANVRHRDFPA